MKEGGGRPRRRPKLGAQAGRRRLQSAQAPWSNWGLCSPRRNSRAVPVGACARAPPHFRCSLAGSLGSASVAVAPVLPPPPTAARASAAAASLPRSFARHPSSPMQRRDDPASRLTRSSGRSCSKDPSGAHPSVRLTPSRPSPLPHRPRGGGGGPRGGARASPATQPPPLLPPSTPGPDATVVGSAPTPLLPPSATAAVKMEPENKYLPELMAEKDSLDPSFTHAMQLLSVGKRFLAGPLGLPVLTVGGRRFVLAPTPSEPGHRELSSRPGLRDSAPTVPPGLRV
jgi:hypothetical protein